MRTWIKALASALGTAAIVGAGQLGVAYALGVLRWDQDFGPTDDLWAAHLTWAPLIAALAVTAGALNGRRAIHRYDLREGFGSWTLVSLAALLGATVTVPLVALPAAAARTLAPLDPALNAGLAAGLGVAVGFFVALAALCARPVAGGVVTAAVWVWLVALVSAVAWLGQTREPAGQRLGVLDLPSLADGVERQLVLPVMVGVALSTSTMIAGYSRWLGEHQFAVATSGLAGPALVAAAYLIAGPGTSGDQRTPWLAALIAAGAGFGASLLVAVLRRRPSVPDEDAEAVPEDRGPATTAIGEARQMPPGPRPQPSPGQAGVRDRDYVDWVSGLGTARPTTAAGPTVEAPAGEVPRQRRRGRPHAPGDRD